MQRTQSILASMEGLSIRQLESVTGGAATWGAGGDGGKKSDNDIGKECAEMAAGAIPQPDVPHDCDAGASASAEGTHAQAGASAQAGYSETQNLGGVTVTTYVGASAQASAQVGPLGGQAGASVSGGFGNHFDLGKGVEIVTEAKGFAGLGVAVGIIDNHAAVGGEAAAGFSSGVSQKFTSEEFGDGARVTQTSNVEAGGQAHAGGGVEFGADGVRTGYDTSAGFYAKAEAGVEVGNDSYSGSVGGKVISPGSVSAGTDIGADFEDGQLKLSLSGEMSAIFGGFGYEVGLNVRFLDSEETRGSTEEINQAFGELLEHMQTEDAQLTEAWQQQLEADINHFEQMMKPLEQQLHDAEHRLEEFTEERENRLERIAAFNTAAMLQDFQDHLGLEQGAQEWTQYLARQQEDLNRFDQEYGPRIHELEGQVTAYHQELDTRQEVVNGLKAELEIAQKGDADNIARLEKEQQSAVYEVNHFIKENEPRLIQAQTNLEYIQDQRDDIATKVIALEILSGEHGTYSGTAEFRAQVAEDMRFLKEHPLSPEQLKERLGDMRQDLAEFDKEHERPVKELQERVNVLGKEFVESLQELKDLQAELTEARGSTFMAQRAQAEMEIRDEEHAVHNLAYRESALASEVSQLQKNVNEEASRISHIQTELDRRTDQVESNITRQLAESKAAAQAHGDTATLEQLARFEEVRHSGNLTPDSFRGADIGSLQYLGQDLLRLQDEGRWLAERQGNLADLTAQLQEKNETLAEVRHDLTGAQERYETAKEEAYQHHPEHAAQMRAEAMQARTDALEKLAENATGENRIFLQDQVMAQRDLQRSLNISAEMSEKYLEDAQERFDRTYSELQAKYDDLKQVEIKRGVLGYVAQGASSAWSAATSWI